MNSYAPGIPASQVGPNPESRKIEAFPEFDRLRFILASVVVLGHEGFPFPAPIGGGLAVDVFFALSGWLIGGILLQTATTELPRFYFNRATRIWVPYFAAILLLYGFAAGYQGVGVFWAKYLFYDVTFTHQVFTHFPRASQEMPLGGSGNQFWSIAVEEQFYLIAPPLVTLPLGRKFLPWACVAAGMAAGGVLGAPIAFGVAAAIARHHYGNWHLERRARPALIAGTVLLLGLLFVYDLPILRALFATGVVLVLAVPGARSPLPVFLGGISYPLYLNHWVGAFFSHGIVRYLLHLREGSSRFSVLYIAIAYGASLATAAIAYRMVDRQVLSRRHALFTPTFGRLCAAVAYTLVIVGLVGGCVIRTTPTSPFIGKTG